MHVKSLIGNQNIILDLLIEDMIKNEISSK